MRKINNQTEPIDPKTVAQLILPDGTLMPQAAMGIFHSDNADLSEMMEMIVVEAIRLYCVSYLFKQTGIVRYQQISNLLADNFKKDFKEVESFSTSASGNCINSKIDLISQAIVSVALFDLGGFNEKQ